MNKNKKDKEGVRNFLVAYFEKDKKAMALKRPCSKNMHWNHSKFINDIKSST